MSAIPAPKSMAGVAQAAAFVAMAIALDASPMLVAVGVGFGAGWAVFYLLTPLLAISRASTEDRVRYLTIVSGLMMLGIGLGPVLGRALELVGLWISAVFVVAAFLSLTGAGLALVLMRAIVIRSVRLLTRRRVRRPSAR